MKKINLGRFKIIVSKDLSSRALSSIIKNSLVYDKIASGTDGELIITAHASLKEKYIRLFKNEGIEAIFTDNKGIMPFLIRYSKRWGLIIGIILMLFCVQLSSKFVWKINIEGNYSVPDEEIEKILYESGLYTGTYIPHINYDKLHNSFLLNTDDIAWISVNINGNVANVKVKERMREKKEEDIKYGNLVAKCDGQIVSIKLYDGIKTVNISDIVKKGDILISGVMDSSSEGVRYVRAEGEIMAHVRKNISVKIPMKQQIKVYTGNLITDKNIKVFAKNINIFKKYRNSYTLCDKIETENNITLFGICPLPITVSQVKYLECRLEEITYTKKEARDMALAELRKEMDNALSDAELISKTVNHYCDFEYYYIECELYCIENIAQIVEFEVTEE